MSVYSHEGKLLIDHLSAVADRCRAIISSLRLFPTNEGLKKILEDLAFLAGAFHDIGKATRYFQHYLSHPLHEVIGPKNHALISALFVKEIAREYLRKTKLIEFEQELFSCMAFTTVRRHHGKLGNFGDELQVDLRGNTNTKELKQQILAFEENDTAEIITKFTTGLSLQYNFSCFKEYILSEAF